MGVKKVYLINIKLSHGYLLGGRDKIPKGFYHSKAAMATSQEQSEAKKVAVSR